MHQRHTLAFLFALTCVVGLALTNARPVAAQQDARMTPLVKAVRNCSMSVVNLRGRKTVRSEPESPGQSGALKQVNGMGTGVIIDSRGYVLTNYHVVNGVREIEVTTGDRQKTTAKLLAHDPETDLAILKVDLAKPLPTIKIGTSEDLMLAETVTAVGNAYGYEHTVTMGIISQLGRTVQVNDEQVYRNLIQTDAAINPGNSGGPLLNVNGEMIGINVAVRIGAQGIAFAIPVNDALEVAAELMGNVVGQSLSHGIAVKTVNENNRPRTIVTKVSPNSPAAKAGLVKGDQIVAVNGQDVNRALDLQTSLVGFESNKLLKIKVKSGSTVNQLSLRLDARTDDGNLIAWKTLGLKLAPADEYEMDGRHPNYKRGLKVLAVRPKSPAEAEGIMNGDVVVAMHGWKTESIENLAYILETEDLADKKEFMFYILRDKEPFWGQMRLASRPSKTR